MRYSVARDNWKPEVETGPLSQVGRRVGATALGLALIVPAVLPDLSASSFGFGSGGFGHGGSGGGNKVAVVNPILRLGDNLRQGENTPVIRYKGKPTYLRLVADDEFDGDTWKPSQLQVSRNDNDVEDGLTAPPGLGTVPTTSKRKYQVQVFDLDETWLPLPYPATKVSSIDGTWLYDPKTFNVFGENSSTRQIDYTVKALSVTPTADELRSASKAPASLNRYLQVPKNINAEIKAMALEVTKGAGTDYDRAMALQSWLRDPKEFTYSQTVDRAIGNGNGEQAIVLFLQGRRGYCVQFASTMAVMARQLGIPARVAVGFATGTDDGTGHYVVGLHDAHAWPELYFQGVGWTAFEPTPGGPASAPPAWATPAPPGSGQPTTPSGAQSANPPGANPNAGTPEQRARQDVLNEGNAKQGRRIGTGPVQLPVLPTVIGLGVLVLLAVPALTRLVVRRRRWRNTSTPTIAALAGWADLQATLVDFGYGWDPSDPPRRGATRLAEARHLVGEPAEALHRLASATERARYAPEMTPVGDLRADVESVRGALAEGSSRWVRWRAVLLPRSTRSVAIALSERVADGFDVLDGAVTAVTRRRRLRRS
jgi:transglutaminase-like putative cysteine protease